MHVHCALPAADCTFCPWFWACSGTAALAGRLALLLKGSRECGARCGSVPAHVTAQLRRYWRQLFGVSLRVGARGIVFHDQLKSLMEDSAASGPSGLVAQVVKRFCEFLVKSVLFHIIKPLAS